MHCRNFIIIATLFTSCFEDQSQERAKVQIIADSLYVNHLREMDSIATSICDTNSKIKLPILVDSLVQVRKIEIQNLRKGL